ncbi:hypothetical protein UFOVP1019_17 [uncultured Caudovirales phage]|uniref:Uncharacterized protein n=1 Tax=uncultured Caudovirales phage TaxID=2100421 RepID=A0A6J5PA42_9CAUD|nr:hypothetical protein UFOVP846_9 [uncultured Caudovirales phage]CAB4172965.1 hypothetical protein UFOVP940_19 [uncultured Caudovirales phage]CAB4178616.1 hypothetical protein UFOVP1019_17 [uncultured Caudovirales phage]CAB4219517.1 hypothetical protein UFOVP1618_51 [uncultured Caudovirales phage]
MTRAMRGAIHSRTMWFSLALMVVGAVYENFSYLQNVIDPKYYGIILMCIGVTCAVLRFYTSMPLDRK